MLKLYVNVSEVKNAHETPKKQKKKQKVILYKLQNQAPRRVIIAVQEIWRKFQEKNL